MDVHFHFVWTSTPILFATSVSNDGGRPFDTNANVYFKRQFSSISNDVGRPFNLDADCPTFWLSKSISFWRIPPKSLPFSVQKSFNLTFYDQTFFAAYIQPMADEVAEFRPGFPCDGRERPLLNLVTSFATENLSLVRRSRIHRIYWEIPRRRSTSYRRW